MKKLIFQSLMSLILLISGRDAMAEYVPGEVLVKFRGTSDSYSMKKLHSGIGSVKKREFGRIGLQHMKLPDGMSVEKAVEYYKHDPNVEYAEPNYIVHAMATPDDTSFGSLWGLNNTGQTVNGTAGTVDADIDAPEAWEITTGSDSVIIAVVDTGVAYNHPDLADNIWVNTEEIPGNGLDDDGNGYADDVYGWDFVDNDGDPEDFNLHGTHVAGTIAAQGNNSSGITGVMWNAKIMPVRFLGVTGSGSTSDAISAILYATANGAHIINNSWGGTGFSQALKDAIDAFPGIVVCAAGNSGRNNDGVLPSYPASFSSPNIISVAATDHNDSLASFSNFGAASVDLSAPGVSVYSSIPQFSYGPAINVYTMSGAENFDSQTGALPTSGSLSGWRTGGTNSTWTITAGTGVGGTNSLEDSPEANYLDGTDSWASYMTPITSVKNNLYTLTFQWKGELEEDFDYLIFNYSPDGINWYPLDDDYITGSSGGGFVQYSTDFTPFADSLDQFYFGVGLYSDASINYTGVYIDNVSLTREPISVSGYSYSSYSGTSMATPHVSGVAGLIKALSPGLSTAEIKDAILKGVEVKDSLSGKVLTGGRLNANKALEYALYPYTPSELTATAASSSQINLSWTDNSQNEDGFYIERKNGADGPFSVVTGVGPNVTAYSDPGLTPSTSYYYRVRAYGASLADNVYSGEASSTTQAAPGNESAGGGGGGGGGGGCFIATAAYGSMMHPYVNSLRNFRDNYLLTNAPGRAFTEFYYRYSPPVADTIRESECLRFVTRLILTPLVMIIVHPYYLTGLLLVLTICGAVRNKRRFSAVRNK